MYSVTGQKMLRPKGSNLLLEVRQWIPLGPRESDKGLLQQTLQSNQSCFGVREVKHEQCVMTGTFLG